MTAEDYMHEIRRVRRRIRMLKEQIERDEIMAAGVSAIRYDRDKVQTSSSSDRMAEIVENIIEATAELKREILRLQIYEKECREVLLQLSEQHERVLVYHYIDDINWSEVARRMNFHEKYIYTIKDEALKELDKVLTKSYQI